MLDADERLDQPLRDAIAAAPDSGFDGYCVRRTTYFCGRPVSGAGWGDERLLRLFRTQRASLEPMPAAGGTADVHERWEVPGAVADLAGRLHHDSYPTVASYRAKFARYTALEAQGLQATPLDAGRSLLRAAARLPWLFVVRGGWRDGWRGAYISAGSAFYPAVVTLKALRRR